MNDPKGELENRKTKFYDWWMNDGWIEMGGEYLLSAKGPGGKLKTSHIKLNLNLYWIYIRPNSTLLAKFFSNQYTLLNKIKALKH